MTEKMTWFKIMYLIRRRVISILLGEGLESKREFVYVSLTMTCEGGEPQPSATMVWLESYRLLAEFCNISGKIAILIPFGCHPARLYRASLKN